MSCRILVCVLAVLLMIIAGAAEPSRVVQAEEILKNISLGKPVEYDGYNIIGDLDLSRINLKKLPIKRKLEEDKISNLIEINRLGLQDYDNLVISPISIKDSIIKGSVDFRGTVFQNHVELFNTSFEGPVFLICSKFNQNADFPFSRFNLGADFEMVNFNQTADFQFARFNQTAEFRSARFNQTANFYVARFNQTADFQFARFNQTTNFIAAHFNQSADFKAACFNQEANFEEAIFGIANFSEVQFNQIAYFANAQFENNTDFNMAQFNHHAWFEQAQFKEDAYFPYVLFNQTANFQQVQFNKNASFFGAVFNQESSFVGAGFLNAMFAASQFLKDAYFDYAQINGTLNLMRTKYDTLFIRWSSIHDFAYDDNAYHFLIENFNKLGFIDDANECYYSYRYGKMWYELLIEGKINLWLFDLLAYVTYGYGLRPVRPLGWAALLILMGGLFFFLTGSVTRSKETHAGKKPLALRRREQEPKDTVSVWEAILLSATYFTSGASSIISATPTEFVPVGRGRYVVVLLRLLGWIFFVLFLSSLTRAV